ARESGALVRLVEDRPALVRPGEHRIGIEELAELSIVVDLAEQVGYTVPLDAAASPRGPFSRLTGPRPGICHSSMCTKLSPTTRGAVSGTSRADTSRLNVTVENWSESVPVKGTTSANDPVRASMSACESATSTFHR